MDIQIFDTNPILTGYLLVEYCCLKLLHLFSCWNDSETVRSQLSLAEWTLTGVHCGSHDVQQYWVSRVRGEVGKCGPLAALP